MEGRFNGDPYCAPMCAGCGTEWPETRVEGIGPESIRCANCGADATPFTFTNGYTIAFDPTHTVGVTVGEQAAEGFADDAARMAALPDNSRQNPILLFAPHDIVGMATRLRPFMGQLGTTPSMTMPDSHNAGDFGSFLIGAPHRFAMTAAELAQHKTDGHMDIDAVRPGAILVCPVKVDGGGVYLGDMHAMQGDGEIAGHTADVSGTVTLEVEVIKGLDIDGPVLFPVADDLPFLARPLTEEERMRALTLARRHGVEELEETAPGLGGGQRPGPQLGDRQRARPRRRAARHERARGDEPRDGHRRDRDRPPPRRRPRHVPRAGRPPRGPRPVELRARAVPRLACPAMKRVIVAAVAALLAVPVAASARVIQAETVLPPGQSGHVPQSGTQPASGRPGGPLRVASPSSPPASTSRARRSRPAARRSRATATACPNVRAGNDHDLWVGVGYAMAQDRLVQLELFRRATQGRLAEVLGESRLDDDIVARRDYYTLPELRRHAQPAAGAAARALRRLRRGREPVAGEAAGRPLAASQRVRPARPHAGAVARVDSASVGVQLARTIPSDDGRELENLKALRRLGAKRFNRLLPLRTAGPGRHRSRPPRGASRPTPAARARTRRPASSARSGS